MWWGELMINVVGEGVIKRGLHLGQDCLFSVEKSDVEHQKREHMSKHKAYVVRHPPPAFITNLAGGGGGRA
jgi:hypothetical protein